VLLHDRSPLSRLRSGDICATSRRHQSFFPCGNRRNLLHSRQRCPGQVRPTGASGLTFPGHSGLTSTTPSAENEGNPHLSGRVGRVYTVHPPQSCGTSPRPEISLSDPINSLLDPDLDVHAVAQVTKERTDPPAPTYPVSQPPFRRDAGRDGRRSSRSFLARFARFAPRKASPASHLPGSILVTYCPVQP
jgi:hypothetical protein